MNTTLNSTQSVEDEVVLGMPAPALAVPGSAGELDSAMQAANAQFNRERLLRKYGSPLLQTLDSGVARAAAVSSVGASVVASSILPGMVIPSLMPAVMDAASPDVVLGSATVVMTAGIGLSIGLSKLCDMVNNKRLTLLASPQELESAGLEPRAARKAVPAAGGTLVKSLVAPADALAAGALVKKRQP